MARFLLHYLVPFAAPTVCWLLWVWWIRRRAVARGEAPNAAGAVKGPWPWLLAAGAVLVMISLFTFALTSGAPPDAGDYRAPRLQDGKVVPPGYD